MAKSVKEIVEAANAVVPRITPAQAKQMMADANTLVIDVRAPSRGGDQRQGRGRHECLARNARIPCRSWIALLRQEFHRDKVLILYCASGGRAALGGKALKEMGYERVYNLGAFKDWCSSGGPIEPAKPGGTPSQPLNSKPVVSAP